MTVCFTGHRPKNLCGYNRNNYHQFVQELKNFILYLHDTQDATVFYSGGAQGFDQLAFWAVAHAKRERPDIENRLVLPDRTFHLRWSEDGCFGQQDFQTMCQHADKIQYAAPDGAEGVKYLFARNHIMVCKNDMVIGLYNSPEDWRLTSTRSGTAECLRYAWNQEKRIVLLDTRRNAGLQLTGITMPQVG